MREAAVAPVEHPGMAAASPQPTLLQSMQKIGLEGGCELVLRGIAFIAMASTMVSADLSSCVRRKGS